MSTIRERTWNGKTGKKSAWQLRYTDAKGERHAEQFQYKRDAEARQREVEAELHGGIHTPRNQARQIKDVVPEWLARKQHDLNRASSTVGQLRTHANRHIIPRIGTKRLVDLKATDVRELFDELTRDLSPTMAKYVARSFRDLMKFSLGKGYIAQNVAMDVRVEIPSAELIETDEDDGELLPVPSPEVIGRILSAASAELAAESGCSALAGLRSEEVRALMWKDVDFAKKVLKVRRAASRKNLLVPTKTGAGLRDVPMTPQLEALLTAWKGVRTVAPNDLVFPFEAGKVKPYERLIRREFYSLLDQLGLDQFGWHQLRDFFASTMVAAGVKKAQLKELMGHKDWATTEKYYLHHLPGADDLATMAKAQSGIKISRPVGTTAGDGPNYLQLVHSKP